MNNIVIGVDFDDVTGEMVREWLNKYNNDNDDNITEADIKTWDIGSHTKIGKKMYDYLKDPSLYDTVQPVENVSWGLAKLRKMNYRVVFITASTPEHAGRKYKWLQEWDLIDSRNNYIEALDKTLIRCDYLIDDSPDNIINSTCQPIVFTREWNKYLGDIYPRVNDWVEIVSYFEKLKYQI